MTPIMKYQGTPIFNYSDVIKLNGMVQLTKWEAMTDYGLSYLSKEQARINADPERKCYIVYNDKTVSLFVNDMTNGEFEKQGK